MSNITTYRYAVNNSLNPAVFCLALTKDDITYKVTDGSSYAEGNCDNFGLVVSYDAGNITSYPGSGTTWFDLSGMGNNGTMQSGVNYSSSNGGVMDFNGSTGNVSLNRPISDDFTISYWFSTAASFGTAGQWYQGAGLVDCEVSGAVNDFGTSIGAGVVMFGTGNPDITVKTSSAYNNGVWHYVTATRVRSTGLITLYVDGVSAGSNAASVGALTSCPKLKIGSIQTGIYFYTGSMNGVKIFNRAFSQLEVTQRFNSEKSRYGL